MTRIKILELRDTTEVGGPGKTILETCKAIDRQRFLVEIGVFLRHDESDGSPFITAARDAGVRVHTIRSAHQLDPRLVSSVARLCRRERVDILHSHEAKSDIIAFLASRLYRIPIVSTSHGWIGNSLKQRMTIAIDRRVSRRFDRVIAVSGPIRDQLLEAGVQAGRVQLIHNAIVLDAYRRAGSSGFLAEVVGHPLPPPVLAVVGRLSAEKGHVDLVEALRLVAQRRGTPVQTVLAGDGPARPQIERQVADAGLTHSIHLLGYVQRPQRVLEEADLLVLPSHTEGLPNAALEALAMDVPVLATAVGGTPDVITDGETGRLVPPRRPDQLADAILEFLADRRPWTAMAERGKAMVARRFDFSARTRTVERLYEEVARKP